MIWRKAESWSWSSWKKKIMNWGLVDNNDCSFSSFHFHQPVTLVCFCFSTCFVCLFVASLSPNFNFKLALLSRARPLAIDRQGRPNWSRLRTNTKMEVTNVRIVILNRPMQVNPVQSWILVSELRILDSRSWIPVFVSRTQILDSNRYWIPDSLSCIPKIQDFSGFRIPPAKISRIPSVIVVNRIWFS